MFDEAKDYEVNGPLFDAGLGEVEPEDVEEVAYRKRLTAQASRRVKRAEDDQTLITVLSNQVDKERDRADRVICSDNLKLRNKELEDTVARMEAEMAELRERYEATAKNEEAHIEDLNERINIAQLLIASTRKMMTGSPT